MVAKVNGAVAAGSFIGHDIEHFAIGGVALGTAANATHVVDTVETKATIVMIGALGDGSASPAVLTHVGVESPSAWTAAALATALGGSYTCVDFTY